MNNLTIVGLTLGITLLIIGAMVGLMPMMAKKGIKVDKIIEKTTAVLDGVDAVVGVAEKLLPNNPTIDIVTRIQNYAKLGVKEAEQLCIASNLNKNDRNLKAKETIYAALKLLNIERNLEIDTIIDGAIEAEVLLLGHKDKTEAEKEIEKQTLQSQVYNKDQEIVQLKQVINQIQGTVSSVPVQ